MFDRFSDNSKRLMSYARREAIRLQHGYISPEHILLGLLQIDRWHPGAGPCRALGVLEECGVDTDELCQRLSGKLQKGADPISTGAQLPFTPPAKKVLELSLEKAWATAARAIGTEHLLLGLLAEGESLAAVELAASGLDAGRLEQAVHDLPSRNEGD